MSQLLLISDQLQYRIFRKEVDLRMGFNALSGLVLKHLEQRVEEEKTVFMFFNKRRVLMKAILYEKRRMSMHYERLHEDIFELPHFEPDQKSIDMDPVMLMSLLNGLSLHL